MGRFTRNLEYAPSSDGESIIVLSENTTDETYKIKVNRFSANLETSVCTSVGAISGEGIIQNATPTQLVLSSQTDYDNVSVGSLITISVETSSVVQKLGFPTIVVDRSTGPWGGNYFTYTRPFWAGVDSSGLEVGSLNDSRCLINKTTVLTETLKVDEIRATEAAGPLVMRGGSSGAETKLWPSGTRQNLGTPALFAKQGVSTIVYGPGTENLLLQNVVLDTKSSWDGTHYITPEEGYYWLYVTVQWIPGPGATGFVPNEFVYLLLHNEHSAVTVPVIQQGATYGFSQSLGYLAHLTKSEAVGCQVYMVGGTGGHYVSWAGTGLSIIKLDV